MLDCAALLLGEQLGAVGDGNVLLRLVGHEVDLEAVEARRLARAGDGGALVEVAVSRYLVYLQHIDKTHNGDSVTYVNRDLRD